MVFSVVSVVPAVSVVPFRWFRVGGSVPAFPILAHADYRPKLRTHNETKNEKVDRFLME